jgi:hypothetical protein
VVGAKSRWLAAAANPGEVEAGVVWSWSVRFATVIGLCCAVVSWGVGPVVLSVLVLGSVTAVIAGSLWAVDDRPAVGRILRAGARGGLILPAAVGLIAVLKVTGVLVVLVLVATSPRVSAYLGLRRDTKIDSPGVHPETYSPRVAATSLVGASAIEPAEDLETLDDEALCLAWRRSFPRLEAADTSEDRLVVVEQRQRYLDELHRRSPKGVAAWLAAGARASGNPLPYVADDRRQAG